MGLFSRKHGDAGRGGPQPVWTSRFTYVADVRFEDTDRWTPECAAYLDDDRWRGLVGDDGSRILPFSDSGVRDLELDPRRRRLLFEIFAMPGSEPRLLPDGRGPSAIQGMHKIAHHGYSLAGFAASPANEDIALVEFTGGASGRVVVVAGATGQCRQLCYLDAGVSGDETPLWSPDGAFILVPANPPVLVDVATGAAFDLGLTENRYQTALDWWPARGASCLLALTGEAGEQKLSVWDLSTDMLTPIGPVRIPRQADLDESRHGVHRPRVSAATSQVLVGAFLGPPGDYQQRFGSAARIASLDADSGALTLLDPPFLGGTAVERRQSRWRWPVRPPGFPVSLAPSIADRRHEVTPSAPDPAAVAGQTESLWLWTP